MDIKILDKIIKLDIEEMEQRILDTGYMPNSDDWKLKCINSYNGMCVIVSKRANYKNMEWLDVEEIYFTLI